MQFDLHESFKTVTLLTQGFFEILFMTEVGVMATRKLVTIKWGGLSFFFQIEDTFQHLNPRSRTPTNTQNKVQFPNINFKFCNKKDFTSLASKIGEVIKVESFESYVKHLTGLMVTIEVVDVSRLPSNILLPLLDLKDFIDIMIFQRILYFGLPNQCSHEVS